MKRTFSFLTLLVLAFSCSEDEMNPIWGKWEIEESICFGCGGNDYPEGNGNMVVFYFNGDYERLENNVVVFKGKYTVTKDFECHSSDMALYTNEGESTSPDIVKVKSNKLTIGTPRCYADGGLSVYRRVK